MGDESRNEKVMRAAAALLMQAFVFAFVGARFVLWLGDRLRLPHGIQIAFVWFLAIAPCVAFLVNCVSMPAKYNIRVDLIVYPYFLFLAFDNAVKVTMSIRKN